VSARATAVLLLACGCAPEEPARARSVLLVTLDTLRRDALSCYGERTDTTQALDRLAREGIVYENAYTTAPITLTAHASLLTGLYPLRHGVRDNGIATVAPAAETLAERARAGGVETAAFVGAVVLDRAFGLEQGFDVYDGPPPRTEVGHPGERPASEVVDGALAWLARRDRARPFFLWLHCYDAHHPYEPRTPLPAGASELERYLAEVRELDGEIGRLLDSLRADGTLDETVVAVTADHGEAFGEHQELTHGPFAWNTTLAIPLVLRFPDGARAGERNRELVSLVDLAPTLAEVLGVAMPAEIDGRSLSAPREPGLYFETYAGYLSLGWSPLAGWIDARGKYVQASRPEFFALDEDPREEHDRLATLAPEERERYRAKIAALAERPALTAGGDALDAELTRGIQGLGYAAFDATGGELPHPLAPSDLPAPHDMAGPWRESMVAQERFNQGRLDEAVAIWRRFLEKNARNGFVRLQLASALMRLKQHAEVIDVLTPMLADAVVQPQVHWRLGISLEKLGRRAEAIPHLEQAVALAPREQRYRDKLAALKAGTSGGDDE
jgi:arylsulfatase A-like enzyme